MVINFRLLFIVMLLFHLILPVFSFKPSGGVLVLDGDDDYAVLPLLEHGYIFPKHTDAFTAEIWFYPKSAPKRKEVNLVLKQQVSFALTALGDCDLDENQICFSGFVHLEGEVHGVAGIDVEVEKDQWNYVAIIYRDSTFHFVYDNRILRFKKFDLMNLVAAEVRRKRKDFFVGGYDEDVDVFDGDHRLRSRTIRFHGEIDAIRFSNIARYDLPAERGVEPFDPPHRFESDEHTLALWNFDEPAGTKRFRDASGNGNTLIGMNGATSSGALAVNPASTSVTTTWGRIKLESR